MRRLSRAFVRLARWMLGLASVCAGSVLLTACDVAKSDRIELSASFDVGNLRCSSTLGYYALPKDYLRVRLMQTGASPPEIEAPTGATPIGSTQVVLTKHPDPALTFCLDHINNPLSKDAVQVVKTRSGVTSGSPFLQSIGFNVTDQTSLIVQAIARTVAIGISRDPQARDLNLSDVVAKHLLADIEFDPFDPVDLARANLSLTQQGKCVFIDAMSVLPGEAERFCNNPARYDPTPVSKQYATLAPIDPHGLGVFYRPKMNFRVNVYGRPPRSGLQWRLEQRAIVPLDNLSPVLALDLTRVAFANKVATFVFEDGSLNTACISKGSELLGFADIPLAISRSLVDLPGRILSIQINQANKSAELVNAENSVIAIQQQMIGALQTGKYNAATPSSASPDSVKPFSSGIDYSTVNLSRLGDDILKGNGFFPPSPAADFTGKSGCPSPVKAPSLQ